MFYNIKGDDKMSSLDYAFTWLTTTSKPIDINNLPENKLKEVCNIIDWDKESQYNKPDFEKDDITVIKAKLKTVEDKINQILDKD